MYLEGFQRVPDPPATPPLPPVDLGPLTELTTEHTAQIAHLLEKVMEVRSAVAIALEHEERREKRIRATVLRARKELAAAGVEDPALEAEFEALKLHETEEDFQDEDHLENDVVDVDEDAPSGIPGMTKGDVRRLREKRRG